MPLFVCSLFPLPSSLIYKALLQVRTYFGANLYTFHFRDRLLYMPVGISKLYAGS